MHTAAGLPATGLPATGLPATGLPATGLPATGLLVTDQQNLREREKSLVRVKCIKMSESRVMVLPCGSRIPRG